METKIKELYEHYLKSTGVSTDTRTLQEGNIWFALKGPNFNANEFATQALESGAMLAVVDDPALADNEACFLVEDGLRALQQLATYHRRQFQIPLLGITGSNGKTTTKELIRDVLAKKYEVLATEGNLNNHIGVALTLLRLKPKHEIAVIEMGANHQKEIAFLSSIAEPTHGLITNIGKAHLEGFGGLEGVFKGKTELYDFMKSHGGQLFVNSRNERLLEKAKMSVGQKAVMTYPDKGNTFEASLVESEPQVVFDVDSRQAIKTQLSGVYNFENLCAALCIGNHFQVPLSLGIEAVSEYMPENNRSQVIEQNSNTIHLDAYNANPTSMSMSVKSFAAKDGAKVVILGDMFELGDTAQEEHTEMGKLCASSSFDAVYFCGKLMKHAHEAYPQSTYFELKSDLMEYLKSNPIEKSAILIKGSRGMALETLLEVL